MDDTWTIGELAEHAVAALAADDSPPVNGRVRDLPNPRLIRWYTTIGLVDPPLGRSGRSALYGRRHLLQLVAVKRRQAAGRSIAEIQLELAAATDEQLERVAALHPPSTDAARTGPSDRSPEAAPPPASGEGAMARDHFWRERPDARERPDTRERPDVSHRPADVPSDHAHRPPIVQGVRLAADLTLLLEVPDLTAADLTAIESAARPLLDELRRRGLAAPAGSAASATSARRPK